MITMSLVFDLDNTLLNIRAYNKHLYKIIARYLSKKYNINSLKISKHLLELWEKKGSRYPNLFDDLVKKFNINQQEVKIMVELYNNYKGKMKLYPDVKYVLKKLKSKKYKLGLITDGNLIRQRAKVHNTTLRSFFNVIIYTAEKNQPKPNYQPYLEIIKRLDVRPIDSFYIGDDPDVDFEGSKKIGMQTIRIKRGEFKVKKSNQFIDYTIYKLKDIIKII